MNNKLSINLTVFLTLFLLQPFGVKITTKALENTDSQPLDYALVVKTTPEVASIAQVQTTQVKLVEPIEPPKPIIVAAPVAPKVVVPADNPDKEYIKKRICEVFGPAECENAIKIAMWESGLRTNAHSRTDDFGVMQINCPSHRKKVGGDCTKLYDLETNLRIAKQIYDGRKGWSAWTTSKRLAKH